MSKVKVAIIGAGPSGLSAANVLQSPQFADKFEVTVYEKNDYVGGKCLTVFEDGAVSNGAPGGYEVGAVSLTKGTSGFNELDQILQANGLNLNYIKDEPRTIFEFRQPNARQIKHRQNRFIALFTNPVRIIKDVTAMLPYAYGYAKYLGSKTSGYTNRPTALNVNISKKYPHRIHTKFSHVMQAFGYAELDDLKLTPPLLYYHQYLEYNHLKLPLHMVNEGMQGIWAKLVANFNNDTVLLNQSVTGITRTQNDVRVISGGTEQVYDYLIVATPLVAALNYLDFKPEQKALVQKMKYNHYITILCKVDGMDAVGTFNLDVSENQDRIGGVLLGYKRYANSDVVCLYLYGKDGEAKTDREYIDQAATSLVNDYGATMVNPEHALIYHWPDYFGHLSTQDLNDGWFNNFDATIQGKDRTLFVSSGLHMETVGASVLYATEQTTKFAQQWSQ